MKRFTTFICSLLAILIWTAAPAVPASPKVDNSIWAKLLQEHVTATGQVDYRGFKADEKKLDQYLTVLSAVDPKPLTRSEQFAFYINAYNAFTIKLVLTKYPGINSIKETGTFFTNPWQKKFIPLNGRTVTLDYIEHEILRPRFKDPRVHAAINCASKSCPKLLNIPYEPDTLESQLNLQARDFVNNPKKNLYVNNTLFLSKIFKWFEDDFGDNPINFIRRYAEGSLKKTLDNAGQDIRIEYLEYDWSLNQ